MNVGSQVLPWTLVSLLSKDKASHKAVLSWVQEDCRELPACPSPVQAGNSKNLLQFGHCGGDGSDAPAQECITSIQELLLEVPFHQRKVKMLCEV